MPGPDVAYDVPTKIDTLASQLVQINDAFFKTKLLDRSLIFNVFSQNKLDSFRRSNLNPETDEDSDIVNGDTPFTRYAHSFGHSFESVHRYRLSRLSHFELARPEDDTAEWHEDVSPQFGGIASSECS